MAKYQLPSQLEEDGATARRRLARYLTTAETSEITRVPVETLRYWRHVGRGPRSFRLGRRVLYDLDDLEQWIKAQRDAGAA